MNIELNYGNVTYSADLDTDEFSINTSVWAEDRGYLNLQQAGKPKSLSIYRIKANDARRVAYALLSLAEELDRTGRLSEDENK